MTVKLAGKSDVFLCLRSSEVPPPLYDGENATFSLLCKPWPLSECTAAADEKSALSSGFSLVVNYPSALSQEARKRLFAASVGVSRPFTRFILYRVNWDDPTQCQRGGRQGGCGGSPREGGGEVPAGRRRPGGGAGGAGGCKGACPLWGGGEVAGWVGCPAPQRGGTFSVDPRP